MSGNPFDSPKFWTPINSLTGKNWVSIAGSSTLQVCVLATATELFFSADYGVTWNQITSLTADEYTCVCVKPDGSAIFVASLTSAIPNISVTTDSGLSWTPFTNNPTDKVLAMAHSRVSTDFYVITEAEFLKYSSTPSASITLLYTWGSPTSVYLYASIALADEAGANRGIFSIGNDGQTDPGVLGIFDGGGNIMTLPSQYTTKGAPVGINADGDRLLFVTKINFTDDLYMSPDGGSTFQQLVTDIGSGGDGFTFSGGYGGIYNPKIIYATNGVLTTARIRSNDVLVPVAQTLLREEVFTRTLISDDGFTMLATVDPLSDPASPAGLYVSLNSAQNPVIFNEMSMSSLTVSSINGQQPGGGGSIGPVVETSSLVTSTLTFNSTAVVTFGLSPVIDMMTGGIINFGFDGTPLGGLNLTTSTVTVSFPGADSFLEIPVITTQTLSTTTLTVIGSQVSPTYSLEENNPLTPFPSSLNSQIYIQNTDSVSRAFQFIITYTNAETATINDNISANGSNLYGLNPLGKVGTEVNILDLQQEGGGTSFYTLSNLSGDAVGIAGTYPDVFPITVVGSNYTPATLITPSSIIVSSLTVSSINGQQPGGGGSVGPSLSLSTLDFGSNATVNMVYGGFIILGVDGSSWGSIDANSSNISLNLDATDSYIGVPNLNVDVIAIKNSGDAVVFANNVDIGANTLYGSLATVSTLNATDGSISSLTVSSINGQQPGGGGSSGPVIDTSTITASTINVAGTLSAHTVVVYGDATLYADLAEISTVSTVGLVANSISTTYLYATVFEAAIAGSNIQAFSIPWSKMQQYGDFELVSGTWTLGGNTNMSSLDVATTITTSSIEANNMTIRTNTVICTIIAPGVSSIFISAARIYVDAMEFRTATGQELNICSLNVSNLTIGDLTVSTIHGEDAFFTTLNTDTMYASSMQLYDYGFGDYVSSIISSRQLYLSGISVIAPCATSTQLLSTSVGLTDYVDSTSTSIGIEINFLAGLFISTLPPTLSSSTLMTSSIQFKDQHTNSNVLMNVSAGILLLDGQPIQGGGGGPTTSSFNILFTSSFQASTITMNGTIYTSSIQGFSTSGAGGTLFFASPASPEDGVYLKKSSDGLTWTPVTEMTNLPNTMYSGSNSAVFLFGLSGVADLQTTDGTTFTPISTPTQTMTKLFYANGFWVCGDSTTDTIWVSSNPAVGWSNPTIWPLGGAGCLINSFAYDPSTDIWVAGGDGGGGRSNLLWAQANPGGIWNQQAGGTAIPVVGSLTFGLGSAAGSVSSFVGVTADPAQVFTSTDGSNWSLASGSNTNTLTKGYATGYGNGIFLVGGSGGGIGNTSTLFYSSNVQDWEAASNNPLSNMIISITYANGTYVASGRSEPVAPFSTITTSSDGITWTGVTGQFSTFMTTYVTGGSLSASASQIPIYMNYTSTQQATISSLCVNRECFYDVTTGSNYPLYVSDATLLFNGSTIQGGGGGATVSSYTTLFTSSFQASTITMGGTLYTSTIQSPATGTYTLQTYSYAGAEDISNGPTLSYSTDGSNWTRSSQELFSTPIKNITVANNIALVIKEDSPLNTLWKSTDGTTFTSISRPGTFQQLSKPFYASGYWLLTDYVTNSIYIGSCNCDGTWAENTNIPLESGGGAITSFSYSPQLDIWVAVGAAGATRSNFIYRAGNPTGQWLNQAAGGTYPGVTAVDVVYGRGSASAQSTFVAVLQSGAIEVSTDGSNWMGPMGTPPVLTSGLSVAYGNGIFVVVGEDTNFQSNIWYTTDPITSNWNAATTNPLAAIVTSVSYANNFFIAGGRSQYAVGTYSTIVTSTDGNTWTVASSGQYSNTQVVKVGGGQLSILTGTTGPVYVPYTSTQIANISSLYVNREIFQDITTSSNYPLYVSDATLLFNGSTIQGGGGATQSSFSTIYLSSFLNFTDQSNSASNASLSNYNSTLFFNTFALVNVNDLTSTFNALYGQISTLSTSLATAILTIQNLP